MRNDERVYTLAAKMFLPYTTSVRSFRMKFMRSSLLNNLCNDNNKHLLDETESNIQFIASGQGNIGRSKSESNIILHLRNQLDVGRGQPISVLLYRKKSV